jgi:CubicO group peptidase (beta-lactamase class C family)
VAVVSRHGEAHVEAIGTTTVEGGTPMKADTMFRITSMSKPVAAVAAMILVEECRLRLDDAIDRWLPELANRRVLKALDGPLDDTVPARRPITVRDLLTFRLGFGMVMGPKRGTPLERAIDERQLMTGPPLPRTPLTPGEWIRRFGTLPLMYQPGDRWMYNTGSDVLSVLIARVAEQPLESFLRARIFDPLGMKDTGFTVPAAKADRLAGCYQFDLEQRRLKVHDDVADSHWIRHPAFPTARDGLVSTADDYLAFGQMLLNMGKHGNARILSRASVETMTTDQLTPDQRATAGPILSDDRGWGFGVSIVLKRDDLASVPGRFGWDGGYGTSWASDPRENLVGILMTQRLIYPEPITIKPDFWISAYQAIEN